MGPITPEFLDKLRNKIFQIQGRSCSCWTDSDVRYLLRCSRKELIDNVNYHMKQKHPPPIYSHTCGLCRLVLEDTCLANLDKLLEEHLQEMHNIDRRQRDSQIDRQRHYHGPYMIDIDLDSDSDY